MKKIIILMMTLAVLAMSVSAADPYANAVESQHRVVNAVNAIGAPDGNYAKLKHGFGSKWSELTLDMGAGEEIYGGPGNGYDFVVIEVELNKHDSFDCAQVSAEISGNGYDWLGLSCHSNGFRIPDGATARYVKILNQAGPAFEVDAIVAKYYMPDDIPEFTTVGAALALLGAGFVAYKKRK